MGLEHHYGALVAQRLHSVQQRLQLSGMVGVVVVNVGAVVFALELESAQCAVESRKAVGHGGGLDAQADGGGGGGQGVVDVVAPGDMDGDGGKELSPVHDVKGGHGADALHVGGVHVRGICHAVGDYMALQAGHRVHGIFVVPVHHHVAGLRRNVGGEFPEGLLDVLNILEKVQMVGLNIGDDRHGGEEFQERVIVFAGLHDDCVALAHAVAGGLQQGQGAADHDGGILLRGHHDMGAHGGGGGLAVGAGDAQGVIVVPHYGAPGLRPLEHRDSTAAGLYDLRVVVMDGRGADDELRVRLYVFGPVADEHFYTHGAQVLHLVAVRDV